jgi:hypothetical protein
MAIEATIRRGYAARLIVIAAVCGVLGLWGVYDYVVAIPRKQVMFERAELLRQSRDALEVDHAAGAPTAAQDAVVAELNRIIGAEFTRLQQGREVTSEAEARQVVSDLGGAIEKSRDAAWIGLLMTVLQGLTSEHRLPLSNYPEAQKAFEAVNQAIDQIGEITAPSQFDRATQWAFILCLPCAPWMLWMLVQTKRQKYRLEDDGTLVAPEGTWKAEDIVDIDMSRWMAKSIAWPVHRDGARIKLDDYRFRDLHLIVGAIAARLHPDLWTAEAKPLVKEPDAEAVAVGAGGDNGADGGGGEGRE